MFAPGFPGSARGDGGVARSSQPRSEVHVVGGQVLYHPDIGDAHRERPLAPRRNLKDFPQLTRVDAALQL